MRLHESERSAAFRDHCREVHGIMADKLDRRTLAAQHRADHGPSPDREWDESGHEITDVRRFA